MTDVAPRDPVLEGIGGAPAAAGLIPRPPEAEAGPPGRGWVRRFWFVPAGVALLGAAALVPSVGGSGPGAGEARVLVDGVAVVTDADGATTTVRDDRVDVGPGDRIAVREGRATFEMADDVRLEGRGRHDGRDGTTVEMAVAPRLVTGALLAVAPSSLELEAGAATVSIDPTGATDGAVRLDRRLGLGVGTYRGRVVVETAGRRAEVPRHRRLEVPAAGALGREGLPLRYEADDAWDRRFLGDALVIDAQVAPLLASLGPAERESFLDPATLRRAMPGLPSGGGLSDRLAELDDGAEALVLAAIAGAVDERPFTTAWDQAAAFQADGAPWGLAAIDQGARSSEVLPSLRAALDTLDLQAPTADGPDADADGAGGDGAGGDGADPPSADPAAAGPGGAGAAADADGGASGPSDPTGGTTVPGGGGAVGPTDPGGSTPTVPGGPTPTVPPVAPPTVPSVPEVVEGVGGAVGGVVDGVTDGVDAVVPGLGGVVDGVVGGVGGVAGGVGGAVSGAGQAAGGPVGGIVGGLGGAVGGLGTGLGTALAPPPTG